MSLAKKDEAQMLHNTKKSENQEMAQESRECKKLREHVRVSSVLSFEWQKRNKVKSEAKGKKKTPTEVLLVS